MVRHAAAFFGGRLGGSDLEVAVHRDGITVDDFTVKPLGDPQGKCRLAAARGAKNHNQQWFLGVVEAC
jgi:hypothetical protein